MSEFREDIPGFAALLQAVIQAQALSVLWCPLITLWSQAYSGGHIYPNQQITCGRFSWTDWSGSSMHSFAQFYWLEFSNRAMWLTGNSVAVCGRRRGTGCGDHIVSVTIDLLVAILLFLIHMEHFHLLPKGNPELLGRASNKNPVIFNCKYNFF